MPHEDVMATTFDQVVKRELDNNLSREAVTVLSGQNLVVGTVLGKITAGAVPTTGTLTGTGNGTMSAVTGGKRTQAGAYTAVNTLVTAHGGTFTVKDPGGKIIGACTITAGAGLTAVFTSDEINFTITDGSTDFILGDYFTVTVPAGGGQVRAINFSGVDGSRLPYGILGPNAVNATATTDRELYFTSGGFNGSATYEIVAGDTITGATSGAIARVYSVNVIAGTWALGTATGWIKFDTIVGTFQSENLNVGSNTNCATIDGAVVVIGEKTVAYTSGGTDQILVGMIITGASSAASGLVTAITLTSGTWAGGTAAGVITLRGVRGTFQAENLNVTASSFSNCATIAADAAFTVSTDMAGLAVTNNALFDTNFLAWPAATTAANKAVALAEMKLKNLIPVAAI
jgi:hypothetical protein